MSGQKVKNAVLAAASAGALVFALAGPANAAPVVLESWNFNLTVANGLSWDNGKGTIAGLTDATLIDRISLQGGSTIHQNLLAGSPFGQTFTDTGQIFLTDYFKEPGTKFTPPSFFNLPGAYNMYFKFTALTGTFNPDSTISFDPASGKVSLILDNGLTGGADRFKDLADFDLIAPSGGTNLDFTGGANDNGHVDVTLSEVGPLIAGLYTGGGATDGPPTLHLVDVDALLDGPRHFTGPGCSGSVDGPTCTLVTFDVTNGGQYNLAHPAVPEPGTLSLLGAGLLFLGFGKRRRKAA